MNLAPEDIQDEVALERINTYRLQQQETVGSSTHRVRTPREQWLPMGAGKPFPPSMPDAEEYVVEFEGSDDPMHPQNWPFKRRYVFFFFLVKLRWELELTIAEYRWDHCSPFALS